MRMCEWCWLTKYDAILLKIFQILCGYRLSLNLCCWQWSRRWGVVCQWRDDGLKRIAWNHLLNLLTIDRQSLHDLVTRLHQISQSKISLKHNFVFGPLRFARQMFGYVLTLTVWLSCRSHALSAVTSQNLKIFTIVTHFSECCNKPQYKQIKTAPIVSVNIVVNLISKNNLFGWR